MSSHLKTFMKYETVNNDMKMNLLKLRFQNLFVKKLSLSVSFIFGKKKKCFEPVKRTD